MVKKCLAKLARAAELSCRKAAEKLDASKSSIHRHRQKVASRSHQLGAGFFEQPDGMEWLTRLVAATILIFGILCGVGSERLALFFSLLSISAFVGVSSSSLKKIEKRMDEIIEQYKAIWDEKVKSRAGDITITPGGDETFFDDIMMLVFMDLESGFLFNESIEESRDHKTWEARTISWSKIFNRCRGFVSDKGAALVKLAKKTLKIPRFPDLFHLLNDISKTMRFSFYRLQKTEESAILACEKKIRNNIDPENNRLLITRHRTALQVLGGQQIQYQKNLRRLSVTLHPFAALANTVQSSKQVEGKMLSSMNTIKTIQQRLSISDTQKKLNRTEKQIPDAAKQVDLWWGWINTSLDGVDIDEDMKVWLLHRLLPFVYWKQQIAKTSSKIIKRYYKTSMQFAQSTLAQHPLTKIVLKQKDHDRWYQWAKEMSNIFIRSSSAIEGRNSWLSQMHFTGRGLSSDRLTSQTAIRNYMIERDDGTTACERLAGIKPENLFNFILDNLDPIPEPRSRGKGKPPDLPDLLAVPA